MSDGLKVFIIGSPRSGTSITYYAMREVFRLKGRGESHVFPLFQRLAHQYYTYTVGMKNNPGVLAGDLDTREFREALYRFLRDFYFKAYKADSFVDKTPGAEAIRGCDFILGTFPDARIILLQRNGIEVVNSFQTKFGAPFEDACNAWQQVVTATREMLSVHKDVLVVDQFDLTNAPEMIADQICGYLDSRQLTRQLATFFSERRVEQQSTHDWRHRLTLADVGWNDAQKDVFVRICGAQMGLLGYSM